MKRLAFVISHRPDNRYLKRIHILKEHFEIDMVFWNKSSDLINPDISGIKVHEVHIEANQTNPLKRLPQTYKFIGYAYKELCNIKPDIVYVGNLDMLHIARKYKHNVNSKAKIVYEIADLHRLIIDEQSGKKKIISNGLKRKEKRYITDVDILVLTSMKFYDVYYNNLIDRTKTVFLPNMPEDRIFKEYVPKDRSGEQFTIGFIGWIRYKDQLRMLIDAAKEAGCNVLFAGTDGDGPDFEQYCKQFSYVEFLGTFNYEEKIKDLYDMVDCTYAVYDADWANVRIALPNKLYESIECEKPIIVAKNTYLSELVEEYGVGSSVGHKSTKELIEEIRKMKDDNTYYRHLVENCIIKRKELSLESYNNKLIEEISKL